MLPVADRFFSLTRWKSVSVNARHALIVAYQLLGVFFLVLIPFLTIRSLNQPLDSNPAGFTWTHIIWFVILPYLLSWIYLGSSIWVFLVRRGDQAGRIYVILSTSAGISLATMISTILTGQFSWIWLISMAMAGGALFHLSLVFPNKGTLISRYPSLYWLGYLVPFVIIIVNIPQLAAKGMSASILNKIAIAELSYIGLSAFVFLTSLLQCMRKPSTSLALRQARISLWGILLSGIPIAVWLLLLLLDPAYRSNNILLITLVFFPIFISYAILLTYKSKHDTLVRRMLIYALLSALTILAYILLVSGISIIFGGAIPNNHPVIIGSVVLFIAITLNPLRSRLENLIEDIFYQGEKIYQKRLQEFAQEITRKTDPESIYKLLRKYIIDTLSPELLHIFVVEPWSYHYVASVDDKGLPTSDLRFPPSSSLVEFLSEHNTPFVFEGYDSANLPISSEKSRLTLLGAKLVIPLPGQQQLVGWLAVGPRKSGESYHRSEIAYLESICNQAALAIERLQVISNLESRVREMDVLTRIAQGVNITLDFDNILELIYAQTILVIPTLDFRITLSNPDNGKNYYAFFVENNERLAYNENITIPPRQGLEGVVIQSRRGLVTADYSDECRNQGVIPNTPEIYAWIGVPLHDGSRTIGCISMGNREPAMVYTNQQLELLQAIADQAAGAIIKSQLLNETDRRARQLATLNEVGRSLTSTLEINSLLKQIMNSAVELLNCEAGSLFTVEPETQDIIIEVTIGPGASDTTGARISARSGVTGKVVETGQPVMINSLTDLQDISPQLEADSGFYNRNLLAVPMKVKETVTGIIEVINKLDGTPFDEDDQGILSTFSSQAAIAIENARLYTQTDEALNARLEEMSVMQRIDRELNTSLDVTRAMRLTLDWSMRQTKSDAGLIGFVDKNDQSPIANIQVIASQGLTNEGQAVPPIVVFQAVQKVIRDGHPLRSTFDPDHRPGSNTTSPGFIPPQPQSANERLSSQAQSQIIIPIRRKSDVIGVFILESSSKDRYSPDTTLFLTRLSDHAAIAISNAQLYEDLQAANIAKSEFVSLVSHELKTPMTSIRGYADLLAQGTVGPINEIQGNFLNTIRSNVSRMSNLVSDLADVSRIEAGKMRLEFGEVPITEIIHEVVNSTQALINEKEHVLELDLPSDSPLVWADHNRLIQVLNNLLSNANKYTPQGGTIKIVAGICKNEWDTRGAPLVVKVSVIDTGYGISPEEQIKIFQKFFRSSDPNIRDVPGTGLGLNITRHLVEMQGGQIWFDSQTNAGSAFHFTIPVAETL